jgi:hypothetical protein
MKKEDNSPSLFSGVMLAYCILLLHVLLIAGLGVLIIFFRGIVAYMPLVLIFGLAIVCSAVWYLFKRLKSQGKSLRDTLNSPLLRGKSIEIDLLGGMASIKINPGGNDMTQKAIGAENRTLLLEDRESERIRELLDLARSLENDHKSQKTTEKTGRNLFN